MLGLLFCIFPRAPILAAGILNDWASWYNLNPQRGTLHFVAEAIALWRRATPAAGLTGVFQTGFKGPVIGFQVLSNLVLGVISFLLSWLVFDWCTRTEKGIAAPTRRWIFTRKGRNSRFPRYLAGSCAIALEGFCVHHRRQIWTVAEVRGLGVTTWHRQSA